MGRKQAASGDQWLGVVIEASEYLERTEALMSKGHLPFRDRELCILWIVRAILQTEEISPVYGNFTEEMRERIIWSLVLSQWWMVETQLPNLNDTSWVIPRRGNQVSPQ